MLNTGGGDRVRHTFANFDAGKTQCAFDADKQDLLAIIETTFGELAPFNELIRETSSLILNDQHQ